MTGGESVEQPIHSTVLLRESIDLLAPKPGGLYVDGTLGLGGHSLEILKRTAPDGRVIGLEWDEKAIALSRERLAAYSGRITIIRQNFAEVESCLQDIGVKAVNGILIDIGISSLQLDQGLRGFSFQHDEPLDMRMDQRCTTTASSLLATSTEEELADIFFYYGEERQARRIAARIVQARQEETIRTSKQLAALVAKAVPRRFHPGRIHVATKVFQALRIAVNTELENLSGILDAAVPLLIPGGRCCVISFHSLEDRIVKRKFRGNAGLRILTPKPVRPTKEEIEANPRARSARLRAAEKL